MNSNLLSVPIHYENDEGRISLMPPCRATFNFWEIHCLKGNLFEDVIRFEDASEAERKIKRYLKHHGKLSSLQVKTI